MDGWMDGWMDGYEITSSRLTAVQPAGADSMGNTRDWDNVAR
jgi:hypothetical protein